MAVVGRNPAKHIAVDLTVPPVNRGRRSRILLWWGLATLCLLTVVGAWMGSDSADVTSVVAVATPVHAQAVGTLTVSVPSGALPDGVRPSVSGYAVRPEQRNSQEPTDQYVGGLYLLQPSNQRLQVPATLSLTYAADEPVTGELTFAYWAVDHWVSIPSIDQRQQRMVSTTIQRFVPTIVAVIATEEVDVRDAGDAIVASIRSTESDVDGDGLTDAEEGFYGTDPRNADTDHDTYSDGVEVASDYDPTGPGTYVRPNVD